MVANCGVIDNQGMFAQVLTMESFKAAVCFRLVGFQGFCR